MWGSNFMQGSNECKSIAYGYGRGMMGEGIWQEYGRIIGGKMVGVLVRDEEYSRNIAGV